MSDNTKMLRFDLERLIPASAEAAWSRWLDPKQIGSPWYGAESSQLELRLGGLFFSAVRLEGRLFPHYGRFLRMEAPHFLEYSWVSEATLGHESLLNLEFQTADAETCLLRLSHREIPESDGGKHHGMGWDFVLRALEKSFEPKDGAK